MGSPNALIPNSNKLSIIVFSINVENSLDSYDKIIPCGIIDKEISNLKLIKDQNYKNLGNKIIENFINNLAI